MRAPDPAFADPRQAVLYDVLDDDRSDLDAYVSIVAELDARQVVDLGCGTGCLAVRLGERECTVVGVDPAGASLDIARSKPGAERVTWVHGDARSLADRDIRADLVLMTGNVAQVFVSDSDWHGTLAAVRSALRPGGWFVFETRRPEVRAWEHWTIRPTSISLPDGRSALVSRSLTATEPPLISFESATIIDGVLLRSASTLRFRAHDEIANDLAHHGFTVADVREAPDRPGKEMVFLARGPTPRSPTRRSTKEPDVSDVPANEFYTGLVADLYTPLKSTAFAPEPYADLIRRFGQPALELGCGDGDPLLDLRAMGLDVDGLDSSPDMIERLNLRAAEREIEVKAWVASMETMQVERTYRTVFLAGPTFNLLPDDGSMQQALHAIGAALEPDGTAVVPLFEPEPVGPDGVGRVTRQETPGGAITCRVVEATRDSERRTQTLTLQYDRLADPRQSLTRDWLIHWVELDPFAEMAERAGLRVVASPDSVGYEPADVVLKPA